MLMHPVIAIARRTLGILPRDWSWQWCMLCMSACCSIIVLLLIMLVRLACFGA